MSSIIDSHSHIQFPAYDEDREAVILRSAEAGVKMIAVGTQASTSEDAIRVAEQYPDDVLGATVGFHPNHASENTYYDQNELRNPAEEHFDTSKYQSIASHPRVIAIGECGLDYYRDQRLETKDKQKKIFIQQIKLAHELQKPVIVHCRSAFEDVISILNSQFQILNSQNAGVIHFFSGTVDDAKKLLDLGFYLGFGGVITFAREYDEAVRYAPLDRILLETDAPYVVPVPYRGKRNEPAYVIEVARKIAELKSVSIEEVMKQTTKNTCGLFNIKI